MGEPAPTSLEEWVQARVRALFGPRARLTRRSVTTRAGPRTGVLVVGYRIVRRVPGTDGRDASEEVLGVSPPPGAPIDLSSPASPEAALQDALRRREEGLGPCEDVVPGGDLPAVGGGRRPVAPPPMPARRPASELTTSTLDLPS